MRTQWLRVVVLVLSALIVGALSAGGAGAKQPGVVRVATDMTGDWGANQDANLGLIGDELGGDLVEGVISMADKETILFTIRVNKLPAPGGTPEAMRYIWTGTVDGEFFELDGKYTNYSRGACDPTAGACPPPRDPGMAPFLVRGDCETSGPETSSVTTCKELGVVQAEFNVDTGAISIPVPLGMIGAKKGSKIGSGASEFSQVAGGPILAVPSAFLSNGQFPNDAMTIDKVFVVPRR